MDALDRPDPRPHAPEEEPIEGIASARLALADARTNAQSGDPPPGRPATPTRKPRLGALWRSTAIGLILFAGLNLLVARSEAYFLRLASYNSQFGPQQALADYDLNPRADVVFMGSSRPEKGFDPAIVEQELHARGVDASALNLSVDGSGADLAYLMLKNVIQDEKKPKIIVYGLADFEFHRAFPGSSQLDYYSLLLRPDDTVGGNDLPSRLGSMAQAYTQVGIPLYRDRDLIRNALSIAYNPEDPAHKFYAPGPYHRTPPLDGHLTVSANYQTTPADLQREIPLIAPGLKYWNPGGATLDRLHAFLDLARARGITVILVNMPVSDVYLSLWGPGNLNDYLTRVHAVARQHDVPLIDLYQDPGNLIPQHDFAGTNHLNQGGAEIASRLIADYLATACNDTLASPDAPPTASACVGQGGLPPSVPPTA